MSWSISLVGTPEKVAEAVEQHAVASGLTGQSKEEYEEAAPHLAALARQNSAEGASILIQLSASGSAYLKDGKKVNSTCAVELKTSFMKILV